MAINTDTLGPHLRWRRLPLLYLQGCWLRLRTRRLPEPPGEREGLVIGAAPALQILVIGDSAAAAVGVPQQALGLAPKLAQALAETTGQAVAWRALGRSGMQASDVAVEMGTWFSGIDPEFRFDLVVTSLGVNDAVGLSGGDEFLHDMRAIARVLDGRLADGGRLVFSRMPPLHRSPIFRDPLRALVQWRLARIDALLAQVADGSPRWQLASEMPQAEGGFAVDGFHPDAGSYRVWAAHIAGLLPGSVGKSR